jgi:hypothetical protein
MKWVGGGILALFGAVKGYRAIKAATPIFRGLWKVLLGGWKILQWVWKGAKWAGSGIVSLGKGFMKILKWAKPFIPWIGRVGGTLLRFIPYVGWVVTALLGLWEAWKNWDSITSVVSNAFQGAKDAVAEGVNWIFKKMNWLIQKLNGFSVPLPDILGGGTIGFNIPEFQLLETKEMRDNNKTASQVLQTTNFPNLMNGYKPKHEKGISDIPYDNYNALLHKGETVLPEEEADLIRDMAGSHRSPTTQAAPVSKPININFYGDNVYSNDMDANQVVRIIKKALQGEYELGPQGVQMV